MTELEEIKNIVAKNRQDIKLLKQDLRRVTSFMRWSQIFGVLKILLIVIPLILGIIYLQPYFKQIVEGYQQLLNTFQSLNDPKSGTSAADYQSNPALQQLLKDLRQPQ